MQVMYIASYLTISHPYNRDHLHIIHVKHSIHIQLCLILRMLTVKLKAVLTSASIRESYSHQFI